jgi:hypothetical protein
MNSSVKKTKGFQRSVPKWLFGQMGSVVETKGGNGREK